MKYPPKQEYRRYRQHQKIKRKGFRYCRKTRYIFISHTYTKEEYEKVIKILVNEFHYAIQQTIE